MTKQSISYNYAMVASALHRGAGVHKNKNVPDGSGNMTFSSSLAFLYEKKEKMLAAKKKSMLLGVLNGMEGDLQTDPLKKRLNSYGFFGKKIQNNPKKFEHDELKTIYLWGQNMSGFETKKIDESIIAIIHHLGDKEADFKNFRKSAKFSEAMEIAKTSYMLVVAAYDESFLTIGEDDGDDEAPNDPTAATLSMAYVKFGTGRKPIISSFERPTGEEGLVEATWFDKTAKDYVLDTNGTVSLTTTRGYLYDFNGDGSYKNTKNIPKKDDSGQSFWTVKLASMKPEDLPVEVAASFSEEILEDMKDAEYISFDYVYSDHDTKILEDVLAVDAKGDAVIVFTGEIDGDIDNGIRYVSSKTDDGKKYISLRIRRGTFYTQKLIK